MTRPNKYDTVLPLLPKLPPEDPSRQSQIDAVKASVVQRNAAALAEGYVLLRATKDEAVARLAVIQLRLEAYEQLLTESQEAGAEGWGAYGVKDNALRLASGETVRVQPEPYGKVVDKEAFRLWCVAPADVCMLCGNSEHALIHHQLEDGSYSPACHKYKPGGGYENQLQLWPSRMNAIVKERLLHGEPNPDGCEAYVSTKVVLVKKGATE